MKRAMRRRLDGGSAVWTSVSMSLLAFVGCQGSPISGVGAWNQPTRVPAPATGSFQVPGAAYPGATGVGTTPASQNVGQQSPNGIPMTSSLPNAVSPANAPPNASAMTAPTTWATSPFVDNIAAAQNQLKQATDSAKAAVMQSTNDFQGQVEQASGRVDRFGAGVVQAGQVLSDAAMAPLPPVMPASATGKIGDVPMVSAPTTSSVSGSNLGPTIEDPNAQWRKPTPR